MSSLDPGRLLRLACRAVVVGCALALTGMLLAHRWLWDASGRLIAGDFVDVWAAGRMVRAGRAAAVYDWPTHKAAEVTAVGHPFAGYYGWHYPPPFLFVADALARLPYVAAELVWVSATLALFAVTVQKIARREDAWIAACAFPASLLNFAVGQNGFLTASLLGGFLYFMRSRPLLSGIFLGLLAYKPQFGIIIPFVLVAAGLWRIALSASVTALAMAAASWFAFGNEAWLAFAHSIAVTNHEILDKGLAGFSKLQSVFGIAMSFGAPHWVAWSLQGAAALTATVLTCALWRNAKVELCEKRAALAAAVLFATPYLYIYDYPVLFIAFAFLLRDGLHDRTEGMMLLGAALPIAAFPFLPAPEPIAPLGAALIAALLARRAIARSSVARRACLQSA